MAQRRRIPSWPNRLGFAALVVVAIPQFAPAVATARDAAAVRTATIQWLELNQRADGSWDTEYTSQRPLVTAEALLALAEATRSTQVTAQRAVSWLRTRELMAVDFRGRRLRALVAAGERETSEVSALLALRNGTLGWGLVGPIGPSAYDTALALDGVDASGVLSIADRNALVASILAKRRFDGGWSGDGTPASDGPSDLTTTAEITRALGGKGIVAPALDATFALLEATPSQTATTLEIAARLAALYRHGRSWLPTDALENELLRDGRFPVGSNTWFDPSARLYAAGLLALTTRPDATFTSPPAEADQDRDGISNFEDLDRDGDGVVLGDLFPTDPAESFDSDGDAQGDSADIDDDGDGVADSTELSFEMNSLDPDTDGDRFADGTDGVVLVARVANAWDLQPDGYVDGEQEPGTNPLDPTDHPGKPGDVAPLGLPNGRFDLGDVVVELRVARDPALATTLSGQNRQILEAALDPSADGSASLGDVWLLLQSVSGGQAP